MTLRELTFAHVIGKRCGCQIPLLYVSKERIRLQDTQRVLTVRLHKKFYYVKEVAAILNLTTVNVYACIRDRKLRAEKVGNDFIVSEADIVEFTKGQSD